MQKKIILIISSIAIIAILLGGYSLWVKREKFKPTMTYSICIWGDSTASVSIQYLAKDRDSNKIMEEKGIKMVRKEREHPLQKWNMIVIKPTYFIEDKNTPFSVDVTSSNTNKVYVAVFDNDAMPKWENDSFLVFHLLMLRSAFDNNPEVAEKSLEEWMEKSPLIKDKDDSTKKMIAQALWKKVQIVHQDSIAHYLQSINYPLFKIIAPGDNNFISIKK